MVDQRPQTQVLHWQDLFSATLDLLQRWKREWNTEEAYCLRHFSFSRVLRCPLAAILDNVTYLPDKMLYCEFQKYEVMNMSVVGGQSKKKKTKTKKQKKQKSQL